jgi:hypothetical protein
MHVGALAMIDVLGFKELTRKIAPERILSRMKTLRDSLPRKDNAGLGYAGISRRPESPYLWPDAHFAFLSDTVVAGLSLRHPDRWGMQIVVQLMARWVAVMTEEALMQEPRFVFRGCIATGEFMMEENFTRCGAPLEHQSFFRAGHGMHAFACGAFLLMSGCSTSTRESPPQADIWSCLPAPPPPNGPCCCVKCFATCAAHPSCVALAQCMSDASFETCIDMQAEAGAPVGDSVVDYDDYSLCVATTCTGDIPPCQ